MTTTTTYACQSRNIEIVCVNLNRCILRPTITKHNKVSDVRPSASERTTQTLPITIKEVFDRKLAHATLDFFQTRPVFASNFSAQVWRTSYSQAQQGVQALLFWRTRSSPHQSREYQSCRVGRSRLRTANLKPMSSSIKTSRATLKKCSISSKARLAVYGHKASRVEA